MFRLKKNNVIVFLLVSAIIVLADALLVQSLLFVQHAEVLGTAIVADFVLVIPLLLYFLVYRKIKKPLLGVLPLAIAGYFAILMLMPKTDNVAVVIAKYTLLPLELAFISYELYKLYRIVRAFKSNWQPDVHPMDTMRISLQTVVRSPRLAAWLLQDISVVYYAFLTWRRKPYIRSETAVYTYHENTNSLIIVLFLSKILLLEGAVVHFLLAQWSPLVAWVLSIGNVWFIILLVANYRAMRLSPILMNDRSIHIQYGIQLRVKIDINNVASVKLVSPEELKERREKEGQAAIQPHGVEPNVSIRLKENLVAYGLFSSQRSVREVYIFIDQPQVFLADCLFRMSIAEDSLHVEG
ncbi:hypothetical protein [Paenibacillus sp. Leaf72]|uniref:hypothetical protein n=1 Tax=Paenibacillus sp. Leaf72 TaxID=1736234 RepID=UPI0006FFB136|nr:hypothetical protein [Paenibacillus sp. Leaf72]KQO10826.1 hypothetical protein ASF12_10595 [Paenibacillus sp. Leaf72]